MAFALTDLIAPALSLFGGERRNDAALQQQQIANEFSAQQFASRYQTTVKDMEAAGLNPMLAYSQGGGVAPTGQQATVSDTITPAVQTYQQNKINSAQVANIEADTENKKAQAANIDADTMVKRADVFLKEAQTGLAGASSDQARANVGYLESAAKKITEEIKNIPTEGKRLEALVKNLAQEYQLLVEKTHSQTQATQQLKWLAVKAMLEGDLLGFDIKAAQDLGNLGRYSKEGKVVLDVLRMLKGK